MEIILSFMLAYILGSVPSAVWMGKWFHGIDVREHGSKNAGATNSFRVLGKKTGIIVLCLDVLKGVLTIVVCAQILSPNPPIIYLMIAAGCCIIGHIFPIFAGFRGGKGVATSLGVFFGLNPQTALCCFAVFLLVFVLTKYVSLASMTSSFVLPFISYYIINQHELIYVVFNVIISSLIILAHKNNIKRLLKGEEQRMNFKVLKM